MLSIINDLCAMGERQGEISLKAAAYIEAKLSNAGLPFKFNNFLASIPNVVSTYLIVDGKEVECKSCSFGGGKVDKESQIVTSLQSSQNHFYIPNINYNDKCDVISTPNYYLAPALAINYRDLSLVQNARTLEGECVVKRHDFTAKQILVGNTESPKHILFSHFDSLFQGAVDNASGVAVMLNLLQKFPTLMNDNLFVFDGNEELSFDTGIYWGHGYREFQNRFDPLLQLAKSITIVDCVGYDTYVTYRTPEILRLAFPISNLEKYIHKCEVLSGGVDLMMTFYHSNNDLPQLIQKGLLEETVEYLVQKLV